MKERKQRRLKIVTGKTNHLDGQSWFEQEYLMEPAGFEKPDCNRISCPVLGEKEYQDMKMSKPEILPYCTMYSRRLRKMEDGRVVPCPQCLRERRSLWEVRNGRSR